MDNVQTVASIGSTSPFIGLFGTVWGIMEALKGISVAGSASLETVAGRHWGGCATQREQAPSPRAAAGCR